MIYFSPDYAKGKLYPIRKYNILFSLFCHKEYPEASGITGGLGHITCMHGVTKGYTAMESGESPALFAKTVFKRLPKKI